MKTQPNYLFQIQSIWKITIKNSNCAITAITHDSNEDVPEAQHTTDDVEDVIVVVRDEDGTEIMNFMCNLSVNFYLLTLEQLEAGIHL